MCFNLLIVNFVDSGAALSLFFQKGYDNLSNFKPSAAFFHRMQTKHA
jgi:hypothetical protein